MAMAKRFKLRLLIIPLVLLLVGMVIGFAVRYESPDQALEVMTVVKMRFVKPVSMMQLGRAYLRKRTIQGMLTTLQDPYTHYLTPSEYKDLQMQTNGSFGGIGITLNPDNKALIIISVFAGTPGAKAGLRGGDRITAVNGRPTAGMSVDEAVTAIRGPVGSTVRLRVLRKTGGARLSLEFKIKRADIQVPSVESIRIIDGPAGKVALVRVYQFGERTYEELQAILADAEHKGVQGLILDLRSNPGGLLDSAIDIASIFLDEGAVMYMQKRNSPRETLTVRPEIEKWGHPVVVLVNEWSASASEIVSGALKDRGAAVLVGARTFGKGLVQEIVPLTRGAALSVTIAEYLTAGGHAINKKGITPDVLADLPGGIDQPDEAAVKRLLELQEAKALEVLQARMRADQAQAS